jgi:hypothetical protein
MFIGNFNLPIFKKLYNRDDEIGELLAADV